MQRKKGKADKVQKITDLFPDEDTHGGTAISPPHESTPLPLPRVRPSAPSPTGYPGAAAGGAGWVSPTAPPVRPSAPSPTGYPGAAAGWVRPTVRRSRGDGGAAAATGDPIGIVPAFSAFSAFSDINPKPNSPKPKRKPNPKPKSPKKKVKR